MNTLSSAVRNQLIHRCFRSLVGLTARDIGITETGTDVMIVKRHPNTAQLRKRHNGPDPMRFRAGTPLIRHPPFCRS
jgi:hypothetical protein